MSGRNARPMNSTIATPRNVVPVQNSFDTEGWLSRTDDEFIVYSELIPGDLLCLPLVPGGCEHDGRILTSAMIEQIPGLTAGIAEQLRAHWIAVGEHAAAVDCERAHQLTDSDLVGQWAIAFGSLGEAGLPFDIEDIDFGDMLHDVLKEKLQAHFPGAIGGCGFPEPEAGVAIRRADLTAGIDVQDAHHRLVAAVPAWARVLDWMAPCKLSSAERWSADELTEIPDRCAQRVQRRVVHERTG